MNKLLIYGATGYTGQMAAQHAKDWGIEFEIAGRSAERLRGLAQELNVPYRVFNADHEAVQSLSGVSVLLNFAGPFAHTAEALMRICIDAQVDYLDITAEINVYRLAESLGAEATRAGVMLMPGVGWDVVPTDCLAVRAVRLADNPVALQIALHVPGSMSRGSAKSAKEILSVGVLTRINGQLISTPESQSREFDFGDGPVGCETLSFGDLVTAWHSTRIPNIAMFVHVSGEAFPEGDLSTFPDGPTAGERRLHRARAVVEVIESNGEVRQSTIETVNGYSYTPLIAIEAARRVLMGERRRGFATPAQAFGQAFAETIEGTHIAHFHPDGMGHVNAECERRSTGQET